jgi:hypothetical protein
MNRLNKTEPAIFSILIRLSFYPFQTAHGSLTDKKEKL